MTASVTPTTGGDPAGTSERAAVRERQVDVLVVGAGPAGLAAAARLRELGVGQVEVVEREQQAGGIPRHSQHLGFGLRDMRRVLTGPAYAQRLVERAVAIGTRVRTGVTATGWADPLTITTTSGDGLERIRARAVVLATGARERPRAARLVPGARPAGVFTTGQLQQAVYQYGQPIGERAVIIGAEHVSLSAALTLRHAGVRVLAMVTEQPRGQSYRVGEVAIRALLRCGVWTNSAPVRILGDRRVRGVELQRADGQIRTIAADTVVFTGDWIPDHELARAGGIDLDPGTRGPSVDTASQTTSPGVFAIGNLVHPVRAADTVSLEGDWVAGEIIRYLDGRRPRFDDGPVWVQPPLAWVCPNRIAVAAAQPPRSAFTVWSTDFLPRPRLVVRQGERVLWTGRSARTLVPNRPFDIPAHWIGAVDPNQGPVTIGVRR